MELLEVIEKRRTVRDFSDKEIPQEIIEKSLEAGLKAPSYNHLRIVLTSAININSAIDR